MTATWSADMLRRKAVVRAFLRETGLCFMLLTLVLVWRQHQGETPSATWSIRAGMLRDLVAELPTGRQAFTGSLACMPLPSVAALPFLPFLPPEGYGYAYLYGLAGLLALAVGPLRILMREWGAGGLPAAAALLLLTLAAALLGPTAHSDLLACLAMLILAFYFETRDLDELRALAGVFWGLVLLAHSAGFLLVALRMALAGAVYVLQDRSPEERGVNWIQGISVVYIAGAYLFLNAMIMGSALYPFRTAGALWPSDKMRAAAAGLEEALDRHCPDRTPVVSGLWGYLVHPLLTARGGYHMIDFHPVRLPPLESRPLVLVVPTPANPLAGLSDLRPDAPGRPAGAGHYLRLTQSREWIFYLVTPE